MFVVSLGDNSYSTLIPQKEKEKHVAASTIQCAFRSFHANRQKNELQKQLLTVKEYEPSNSYLKNKKLLKSQPKADAGNTKVYFPENCPFLIIKATGRPSNIKRLEIMKTARNLCQQLAKKHFLQMSHLIIPRAYPQERYLIEERIPIQTADFKTQMGIYIEYYQQLNAAIKEFIHLYLSSDFEDLLIPITIEENKIHLPRYDNIPFFISPKDGSYNIALVDLEDFSLNKEGFSPEQTLKKLEELIILFPLHYNLIIEESQKYLREAMNGEIQVKLEKTKNAQLNFLFGCWNKHKHFIQEVGGNLENPSRGFDLSSKDHSELISRFTQNYQTKVSSISSMEADMIDRLAEKIPHFIENCSNDIKNQILSEKIENWVDLVSKRTIVNDDLFKLDKPMVEIFKEIFPNQKEDKTFYLLIERAVASCIEELVKMGKIHSYGNYSIFYAFLSW
jgi:hypothetical protein